MFFLVVAACGKKNDTVQGAYVDAYVSLSDPSFYALNAINGWAYYSGENSGHRGLIVFRRTQDEFEAFDRLCPYDPTAECALVEVESSGITAVDSCCGSRYQLTDGVVIGGPSKQSLIRYETYFDGSSVHIFN